ncbi:XapX domain-containing protein [Haladaptatus salinisoli]|uniref:XapX domain-containing protein n=1 Tax=Haladaptatus salinisoli TaxID=2884876 RepID=UPI001D0BC028|nr:DUF1427 family protein [Haladaptatus salinisoli]
MNLALTAFALLTGLLTGAFFKFLGVPIPAPPELPGVMGIVGIYLGYKVVDAMGWSVDLLSALGLAG